MRATIKDGSIGLYDGDTLVRVDCKANKTTIECNGDSLCITLDQIKELLDLMLVANVYALVVGEENGE